MKVVPEKKARENKKEEEKFFSSRFSLIGGLVG